MRILRGRWAGRELASPSGRVRPTTEEVRDAWVTGLEPVLSGARVLELYAGTGAVGLEALSRGAARCDFVENGPSALHALKSNVTALRARDRTRIFKKDALRFIESVRRGTYDVVLADPPYRSRQLDRLIEAWLSEPFSELLAVEHALDHPLPQPDDAIQLNDSRISIYRQRS
jgi:16S rRNA (guanine966-N2)-methyltransferase